MKNGPKKIRGQIQHIEQFINLLVLVMKNTSLQTSEVSSVVKTCSNSAQDIKDSLESYLATPDDGKRVKLRRAFTGVRAEKKTSSMIADLEREKSLLSLYIQKIDLSLLQKVDLNAKDIKLTVGAVANDVTDVKSILISMNSGSSVIAHTENNNKSHFIVPNRRVSGFIGREDILEKIEKGLSSESEPRIVVLRGLGGQGKTQIALEYCHRARKNNIRAIFWIDATSESTVNKDFKSVLERIRSPADSTQDDQVVTSVLNRLRDWGEPWLIVFDNHDDPSSFHLLDFMPSGQYGRILITSRHADTAFLAEGDHDIELHGLPENDACSLLIKQSRVSDTASCDDAYAIVDRLGYHALAITQAGSYIQTQKIQLSQFMDNYNRQRDVILRETPRMSQYRRKIGEAADETALNVFTTWELSYQQFETLDDEKKYKSKILTLFAFFNCQNISQRLFENYCTRELFSKPKVREIDKPLLLFVDEENKWDEQKFVDILNDLSRLSLIQSWYRDENNHCHLSLHPLVQDWIRVRASPELCFESAVLSTGQLVKAEKIFRRVIEAKERLFGHDVVTTLASILGLAEVLRSARKYADAEALYRNLVHDGQRIFGTNHPETILYMRELGYVLKDQRKYSESLPYYEIVHTHDLKTLGPNSPNTLAAERNYVAVRKKLEQQLQREQRKARKGSSTSLPSDSESDTGSEVSELGDESIFSTYERNLLWSSDSDTEQVFFCISKGEEEESAK
ncbi:hypothetical protein ACHAPC_003237 [Botrytis cinerea]